MSVSVDAVLFLLMLLLATRWDHRRAPVRGVLPTRLVALLPLLEGIARVEDEVDESLAHPHDAERRGDGAEAPVTQKLARVAVAARQ